MQSSNHRPHASIASSLPRAASKSATVQRGKLEISNPIPMLQEDSDESDARIDDGRVMHHSSTSFAKTDTWPRKSMAPALQDLHPHKRHIDSVSGPSNSSNNKRTSVAMTNTHQSLSSIASGGSMRKSTSIKATFRRMFRSRHGKDMLSTGANDHRNVRDTNLYPGEYLHVLFSVEPD